MEKILQDAIVQMVRIGNKVNWNESIDNDYVNALNGLRALLEATQQSVHLTALRRWLWVSVCVHIVTGLVFLFSVFGGR